MNKSTSPRISIIIACLNAETKIARTIQSVIDQNYPNTEIILIDGDSRDKTLEIVKTFESSIRKIISEKDSGIGDAWNKGLLLATGSIIGILNAGDYYADSIFKNVGEALTSSFEPIIGYGDTTFFDEDDCQTKVVSKYSSSKLALLNGFGFMHPSVFFTRNVLELIGTFDVRKRIAVDTDWLLRARIKDVAFIKIPSHAYMESNGLSTLYQYTGMGEYLDSLVKLGIPRHYLMLFFLLRFLGATKSYLLSLKHKKPTGTYRI